MIITNSNQLHDHLYECMQEKRCFKKFSYINENEIKNKICSFSANFRFRAEGKKVTSHAENRLGLITITWIPHQEKNGFSRLCGHAIHTADA